MKCPLIIVRETVLPVSFVACCLFPLWLVVQIRWKFGFFWFLGHFKEGKRNGEGLFTYPNKDIYSGMWKAGKKHGKGTYVFSDTGIKLSGEWTEGQILQGQWILPNGDKYEGEFENNMPCGRGTHSPIHSE